MNKIDSKIGHYFLNNLTATLCDKIDQCSSRELWKLWAMKIIAAGLQIILVLQEESMRHSLKSDKIQSASIQSAWRPSGNLIK